MKGKPWTKDQEQRPIQFVRKGKTVDVITKTLDNTEETVYMKLKRLGLVVVVARKNTPTTTTSANLPEELPTIEEVMKILTGVLEALKQLGIDQTEVIRLRSLIQAVKIYKELFADYVHCRDIEAELVKLRRAYEGLVKKANDDPKRT